MLQITSEIKEFPQKYIFSVKKGRPTVAHNLLIKILDPKTLQVGLGEAALGTASPYQPESLLKQINLFCQNIPLERYGINDIAQMAKEQAIPAPARAALDMALWDLLGKQCNLPCYQFYGITPHIIDSSVTIGANAPETITDQVIQLLTETQATCLKIKLGAAQDLQKDKEVFLTARKAALEFGVKLRVDVNGGWTFEQASEMLRWLKQYDVEYIEQPLDPNDLIGQEKLHCQQIIPILLDESCQVAGDIPRLADICDGIVVKLMKCGGIGEALQMLAVARALNLKTVLGCKSESSVGIATALAIAPLFDYHDLDAHFYLENDLFKEQLGSQTAHMIALPNSGYGLKIIDNQLGLKMN